MGAEQSAPRGSTTQAPAPQKTCYYELLGVERDAADEEYVVMSSYPLCITGC